MHETDHCSRQLEYSRAADFGTPGARRAWDRRFMSFTLEQVCQSTIESDQDLFRLSTNS